MLQGKKPSKEPLEEFPYSLDAIIRLLAGGTCKLKDLFAKEDYEDAGSIRLGMSEDSYSEVMSTIGEDYELIELLKAIYDWGQFFPIFLVMSIRFPLQKKPSIISMKQMLLS